MRARSGTDIPCETSCSVELSPFTYDGYDQHVPGIDHSARLSEGGCDHTDSEEAGLDINLLKNYRPVSNNPFLGKVMERVVAAGLTCHVSEHGFHDPICSQRTGRATALRLHFCGYTRTLGGRLTEGRTPSWSYWICRRRLIPSTMASCWVAWSRWRVSGEQHYSGRGHTSLTAYRVSASMVPAEGRFIKEDIGQHLANLRLNFGIVPKLRPERFIIIPQVGTVPTFNTKIRTFLGVLPSLHFGP